MTEVCACCRQPLPETRGGIKLSPLKTHIFDVVARAGADGVTNETINSLCFDGRSTASNVKTHIEQINSQLAGSDLRIFGGNPRGFYRLVRETP